MSPTAIIPPELIDETIDHLWNDPASLRACSLTCKAWLPTSRLHLFRTVRLNSLDDCERFSALLDSTPVIEQCVRSLTITAEYSGVDGTREQPSEVDSWVNSAADVAKRLPRIHTLALSRMRWNTLHAEKREAFKGMCRSVRKLFLYELRFHSSGDVLDFLNTFPELDQLYFHAVSWDHESAVPSTSTADFVHAAVTQPYGVPAKKADKMHLSYLFLDPRSSPTLVAEWILSHPSDQRLRTIQLCWREMDNTKALGDMLRASGSSLEHLQIEFPDGIPEEAVLHNHLSLASNTALRSLSFGGLDVSASNVFLSAHLFPWVTHMLSELSSPHLREVTFELETRTIDALACLDWARIDAELSRSEFTGLFVKFYVNCDKVERGTPQEKEVKKQIEGHLPGFLQRGRLHVSCI